jgi:cobaltochelatase CobT
VFKNKIKSDTLNAAISVLVDFSGSMSGDKLLYATGAAVLLNQVSSTLNIPLEITGFTDIRWEGKASPVQYIFKPFGLNRIAEEDLLLYFGAASTHMTGNPDGENILWAYDRIVKRKEKKKLLIVMSDGQPAASRAASGISHFTHTTIKEIERLKHVDIYGLGLESDAVQRFYKANSVITAASEIPTKLLELIERKLLND